MIEIKNKKATFDYFIEEELEAGIVLKGTEIKSIRNGLANLKDCYAIIKNGEVFLLNMFISKYENGSIFNHDERRTRKLLLNKKEILKLRDKVEISGYTLIPIKLYFKNNKAKILLGVAKGKKNYDKRESIKEKDIKRDIEKETKYEKKFYKIFFFMISLMCLVSGAKASNNISCTYKKGTESLNAIIYLDGTSNGSVTTSSGVSYYYGNNNATVYSWAQCLDCFFSVDYYKEGDDMVQDWEQSNKGGCPPYFHIYTDTTGNSWYGYFSDVENPKSKGATTEPNKTFTLTSDSNVEENEEGEITPTKEKHACNYSTILKHYGEFETILTINTTDNVIYFEKGLFRSEEEYEKNTTFKKDVCPTDLYACFDPLIWNNTTVEICSEKDIENGTCNVSSYENYCAKLVKTSEKTEIGTNGCTLYYDSLRLYNEKIYNGKKEEASKIKSSMKKFCSATFKYTSWDNYEYSCIRMCSNIQNDYGDDFSTPNDKCGVSERLTLWIANIIRWVKYIIPVAVIVLGILDFMKAIGADKEDEMKKAVQRFIKRLIAAALIFIIPFIIEFILNKMGFDANGCGIINL